MRTIRHLLNTIYITQPDMYLSKDGETILIQQKGQTIKQLPIHNIEGIVMMANGTITPQLINMCSENNIHVSFISYTNKFLVNIQNPIQGNVRLRRKQYQISDQKDESVEIARSFLIGKVYNSRCVLQRLLRDHPNSDNKGTVSYAVDRLAIGLKQVQKCNNLKSLLGVEGEAAKNYYSVFNNLITALNSDMIFMGRSRRPPLDEVNAMLSFFYTLLAHDCTAALETVGLDPQVGFYHQERPGRASLALDMMEELRPYLVDRFVVTLINNKQVSKNDFYQKENGAVFLKDEIKKKALQLWQMRKQDLIEHPFLKEKIEIGLIPYSQALLLARFVREDLDGYPPFFMR